MVVFSFSSLGLTDDFEKFVVYVCSNLLLALENCFFSVGGLRDGKFICFLTMVEVSLSLLASVDLDLGA